MGGATVLRIGVRGEANVKFGSVGSEQEKCRLPCTHFLNLGYKGESSSKLENICRKSLH